MRKKISILRLTVLGFSWTFLAFPSGLSAQEFANVNPAAAALILEGDAFKDDGSIKEAEAIYRQVIEQYPDYANGYRVLGLFVNYYYQNQPQQALEYYTKFRDLCQAQNLDCVDYGASLMQRVQ
ncbi:MAG TPA: hypothetical protein IGS52_21200 [Oscillatoriaceae cyanobacterium M33_DOE_052]|uniref:Uncharacterized protein n=1 Tax=Planktothricoides sp. SpSt-374 TaxID=2282167 RepID=A0A7C3ZIQ7_9CYAN|nr:hypothetical protein [Oscillatoriaceae cyanobacterium M33_DOE_052]